MIVLRNNSFRDKCPKDVSLGDINLRKCHDSKISQTLSKYVEPVREKPGDFICYDVVKGNDVIGNLHLRQETPDSLEIAWIDIDKSHRGNKHATKVIDYCKTLAKDMGFKTIDLEVPGNAPDARHIYEKLGFVADGSVREKDNDSWDGLYKMSLTL